MSAVGCVGERLGEIIGRLKRSKFPEVSPASLNETSTAAFLLLEPLLLEPLLLEPLLLEPLLLEPLLLEPLLLEPLLLEPLLLEPLPLDPPSPAARPAIGSPRFQSRGVPHVGDQCP